MADATKTTSRHQDNLGKASSNVKDVDSYSFECPDCHTAQPVSVESNQKHIQCIQCKHKFDVAKLLDEEPPKPDKEKVGEDPLEKGNPSFEDVLNREAPDQLGGALPDGTSPKGTATTKLKGDSGAKTPPEPPKPPANKKDPVKPSVQEQVPDPTPIVKTAIDFLKKREAGLLPCIENREALRRLEAALQWLIRRTSLREEQGVEGTERAHRSNL